MRLFRLFALASLPLLGACQSFGLSSASAAPQRIAWEEHAAGCQGERCSLVNVDTLKFAAQPRLNALIEQALLAMTAGSLAGPAPASLRDYAQVLLREAPQGHETWLQAKLIDRHDDLAVIELSSYLYSGGAHGLPGRGFINYSLASQRALQLADVLIPGGNEPFWQAASEAHQRWLQAQGLDKDGEFRSNWPFKPTANVALLKDKVLLKYDSYAIAPYVMGHPTLEIPYSRLRNILKQQYLPQ